MFIYGKNVIKEAVFAKRHMHALYVDERMTDHRFLMFLKDKGVSYQTVSKAHMNTLVKGALHQGVVAEIEPYARQILTDVLKRDEIQRFLILDGIEDPHNFGAIIRTAEATGLDGIIIGKKHRVPLNATVAKVSSGAIEHVAIIEVPNINQAIAVLKDHGVWVIGTDGDAETTYDAMPTDRSLAVILGAEGEGIRPLVKRHCDLLVHIPMKGKIKSLNVSVAAALMMYAMLKP
ncbi:MAG: 23S rRNA (guanosine(2251)-2'-O)-methyltransferase RlmB [Acholeplasmataceae bacterium]|nr:MAG: 23S rRNA (guanosine(2251)-2'-O)-methyltransferase RlmB [Acholeplasmataceae bacterium]